MNKPLTKLYVNSIKDICIPNSTTIYVDCKGNHFSYDKRNEIFVYLSESDKDVDKGLTKEEVEEMIRDNNTVIINSVEKVIQDFENRITEKVEGISKSVEEDITNFKKDITNFKKDINNMKEEIKLLSEAIEKLIKLAPAPTVFVKMEKEFLGVTEPVNLDIIDYSSNSGDFYNNIENKRIDNITKSDPTNKIYSNVDVYIRVESSDGNYPAEGLITLTSVDRLNSIPIKLPDSLSTDNWIMVNTGVVSSGDIDSLSVMMSTSGNIKATARAQCFIRKLRSSESSIDNTYS